ncbi:hypothetical protein ET445_15945 [Agromyces protaetiae]|uniref:Acyl-CoA carboxylase subunit epsilon n=1 Tax=Agromyces protaetiae TaxID=2509455 RepID=A0A4P6FHF1_9MICO|nr:hypothetical protein [Agromyces protaetiae]QAY74603.1 hypothetical protein ET445_15945 [Agromyces protaetiae]
MTEKPRQPAQPPSGGEPADPNEPDLRFRTEVSAEEQAAAHAVLVKMLAEHVDADESELVEQSDRWVRAAGAVRSPLSAGPGRWSSYGR